MTITPGERVFTVAGFDDERVGMQCADILESEEKIHELFITTFATIGFQLFYGERYGYDHNEDRNVLNDRGVYIAEIQETVGLIEILAMYSLIVGRNTSKEYEEVLNLLQDKSVNTMAFNFPAVTLNRYLAFNAVEKRIRSLILPPEIANETNRAIVRLTSLVFAELITQGKKSNVPSYMGLTQLLPEEITQKDLEKLIQLVITHQLLNKPGNYKHDLGLT